MGTLKICAFLAACCFTLGAAGYFLLWMIMPEGWVFGALYRMFVYHWEHPLQYIGLMSVCYSLVATVMISLPGDPVGKHPRLAVPLIIGLSILIASPAGGVLWVIHDMQAGYFPEGSRFWDDIQWGAKEGIRCGWLIILTSMPYNILGLVVGYHVTLRGYKMTLRDHSRAQPLEALKTLAELEAELPHKRRLE